MEDGVTTSSEMHRRKRVRLLPSELKQLQNMRSKRPKKMLSALNTDSPSRTSTCPAWISTSKILAKHSKLIESNNSVPIDYEDDLSSNNSLDNPTFDVTFPELSNVSNTSYFTPFASPKWETADDDLEIYGSLLSADASTSRTSKKGLADGEKDNGAQNEQEHDDIPLDWTLKKSLHFSSHSSFNWTQSYPTKLECEAMEAFLKKENATMTLFEQVTLPGPDSGTVGRQLDFIKSLMYWRFPLTPLSEGRIASLKGILNKQGKSTALEKDILLDFKERKSDWEAAFFSFFHNIRNGFGQYGYVQFKYCTVLFTGNGADDTKEISAKIARSTDGLREQLKSNGIDFAYSVGRGDAAESDIKPSIDEVESRKELDELEKVSGERNTMIYKRKFLTRRGKGGANRKVIHVQGRKNVSLLFDFLLNAKLPLDSSSRSSKKGLDLSVEDIPLLISDTAFVNSSISRANFTLNSTALPESGDTIYSMKVEGPISPENVGKLIVILSTAKKDLTCTLETESRTFGLNSEPEEVKDDGEHPSLGNSHIKSVRMERGKFILQKEKRS